MANITKTVTYKIPNERYGTDDSMGKTSTQEYNGPASLMLFMDKETNMIKEVQDMADLCGQPTPLDFYELVLDCEESDENCIRCGLIGPTDEDGATPFGFIKVYEVAVGPASARNNTVFDTTYPSEVYDQNSVTHGYNPDTGWGALSYETGLPGDDIDGNVYGRSNWDIEFIRSARNDQLEASDASTSEDMPTSIKQGWVDYRANLRNLPDDWAGVPVDLIVFPKAPGEPVNDALDEEASAHIKVIKIAERTAKDKEVVAQLPSGVE